MLTESAQVMAFIILFLVIILLLLYLSCRKPKGYPPGPRWWPILGCALEVARIRQKTGYLFKSCSLLCKKYGPIVGLKIGSDRMVILNDLDSIRAMLTNEDCDGRPTGPIYQARTWGTRKGLIVVDEQLWVEQRRFVLRHLREFGFGRADMAMIIQDEVIELVQYFKKLLQNAHSHEIQKSVIVNNNNNNNNNNKVGKIYMLQKDSENNLIANKTKLNVIKNESSDCKFWTAADLYMKAENYKEVKRASKGSESTGIIIHMDDAFGVTVLNTLWRMMASKRYDHGDKELVYLQRILTKLLKEIDMTGALFSHFPFLRFIAPELSGFASFLKVHQELWAFLQEELNNHKNTFVPSAPRDLMDVYLTALNSKDCSDTFSESQLLAICMDLFMAGSETTSKALSFGFLYLMLFPQVQKKAQKEIDQVLGRDRFPTLDDRAKMPYVQAIVLESLRMFMGRTMNVPHRALKDTSIMGHKIPKDTMLVVNFNRVLMDESWGDPEDFRPERFLDCSGKIVMPDKYFPFSIGRHRCMGDTLARSNIFVITAALLQTFNFSVVPSEPQPSVQDFMDGVTASPKPYKALISLRK